MFITFAYASFSMNRFHFSQSRSVSYDFRVDLQKKHDRHNLSLMVFLRKPADARRELSCGRRQRCLRAGEAGGAVGPWGPREEPWGPRAHVCGRAGDGVQDISSLELRPYWGHGCRESDRP